MSFVRMSSPRAAMRSCRVTPTSVNHADDGDTLVALPFSFQLYDQVFNGVNVSSNGRARFCVRQ